MTRLIIKLAVLALAGAAVTSTAHAQAQRFQRATASPGTIEVIQEGRGNGASAAQNGAANDLRIVQYGADNTGRVAQDGVNNAAAIKQLGKNNDAAIAQTGDNNTACVLQVGRGLSAGVTQTGGQSVGVLQTRRGSKTFPGEHCMLTQGNPVNMMKIVRNY